MSLLVKRNTALKHQISIAVGKDGYQFLNASGISISGLVNNVIGEEIHHIKAENEGGITIRNSEYLYHS
ncbi:MULTISPECIES: type II toxin-antitoxin system CcdA family antitoxin [Pectobacterium]|uniref:type II toxin-antitoxin system CcdA family antitoxin n=1 Tax=Pectobacterium TaxID=122277 RepID=UPI00355BC389